MAGNLCQISFYLECLLICVSAYCQSSDQSEKCISPKEFICVPDECGNPMYVCEDPFPVEPGKCPYYNKQLQRMDVTECTAEQICPNVPYLASTLVEKSKDCLAKPKRTNRCSSRISNNTTIMSTTIMSTTIMHTGFQSTKQHQTRLEDSDGSGAAVGVGVVVLILVVVLVVVVLVVFYRKDKFGVRKKMEPLFDNIPRRVSCMHNEEQPEPEDTAFIQSQGGETPRKRRSNKRACPTLCITNDSRLESDKKLKAVKKLYSLVLFLKELPEKRNINIGQKVKEAKYVYKKSFIDDLNIESDELLCLEKGDFKASTNSTVFIILTNLCDFKIPTRGWENQPLRKDVSLEADIARIRTLWNEMCDGDVNEKIIEETFERLRKTFGKISFAGVETMGPKEKIDWKQLKPDFEVYKDVVLTKKVKSIIQKLNEVDLVVCIGVIGSGKSEALKYIAEKYHKEGWKVELLEKIPLSTDIQKANGEKVLLCCDNFFGDVAYEYFTLEQLKNVKDLLEKCSQCRQDSKTMTVKLLASIHKHVLQELEKDRRENFDLLTNYNFTVDMNQLTSAEHCLIFKETIRKGCLSHKDCWYEKTDFSSVETKLKNHSGKVGNPFLLMAFAKNHTFFADDLFLMKPIKHLERNFDRLRLDQPKSFYILLYILFVREHHKDKALKKWAQELPAPLNKEDLDEVDKTNIAAYLHHEGDTIRISHELFQIALFWCISAHNIDMVLKFCELRTMLSICRPYDDPEEFSVKVDNNDFKTLNSRDECKDLILKTGHPLKRFFESEATFGD